MGGIHFCVQKHLDGAQLRHSTHTCVLFASNRTYTVHSNVRSLRTRSLMHVRQPPFIHPVLFYDVLPHVLFYCFIQLMCNYLINEGSQDTLSAAKMRNRTVGHSPVMLFYLTCAVLFNIFGSCYLHVRV